MSSQVDPISLTVPREMPPSEAADMVTALRVHICVDDARWRLQKSADPGSDLVIQLIGNLAAWLPLSAAATVFLTTIAKRAGDATWDAIANVFKTKEVRPLAEVATTLGNALEKAGPGTQLIVGLSIPEPNWGTVLLISETDPLKIATKLAEFVSLSNKISMAMEAEVAAGRAPLGRAQISIEDDGAVIRWVSQRDFARHEKRIS